MQNHSRRFSLLNNNNKSHTHLQSLCIEISPLHLIGILWSDKAHYVHGLIYFIGWCSSGTVGVWISSSEHYRGSHLKFSYFGLHLNFYGKNAENVVFGWIPLSWAETNQKWFFDKYLIRLISLILMNGSHNYISTTVFDTLTNGCGGSLIEKTAKFASHTRSWTLRFLRWSVISQKRTKIVDVY